VIGSSTPASGETAPLVPPVSDAALDRLADLLQRARGTLVLTGAGCSTESGVPDYRGPAGAYTTSNFKPMTHQQARLDAGWA
jgi:NAD-dependent deacetylase sirtuin 4